MHFADLVNHAGVEENALGQCRLASIDVRADPYIAGALQREGAIRGVRIGCFGAH